MILPKEQNTNVSKPQIERVEKEKIEDKIIGTYLRRRGLKLFAYDHIKDVLYEVRVDKKETLHLTVGEGGLTYKDKGFEKAHVDSRHTHFEALNITSAQRRLQKFKEGKIPDLCNLRKPGKGIKIF